MGTYLVRGWLRRHRSSSTPSIFGTFRSRRIRAGTPPPGRRVPEAEEGVGAVARDLEDVEHAALREREAGELLVVGIVPRRGR